MHSPADSGLQGIHHTLCRHQRDINIFRARQAEAKSLSPTDLCGGSAILLSLRLPLRWLEGGGPRSSVLV
jgi:hypothetical protein